MEKNSLSHINTPVFASGSKTPGVPGQADERLRNRIILRIREKVPLQ